MTARMRERAASSFRLLMASESKDEPNSAKNILEKDAGWNDKKVLTY